MEWKSTEPLSPEAQARLERGLQIVAQEKEPDPLVAEKGKPVRPDVAFEWMIDRIGEAQGTRAATVRRCSCTLDRCTEDVRRAIERKMFRGLMHESATA